MSGYRGRFAPSPTGPLHLGSLVAALGSWIRARQHDGRWLVRIEDIDPPRTQPGAAETQLAQLDALGLRSDEPVMRQSARSAAYAAALDYLLREDQAFECRCSRADLAAAGGLHRGPCAPSDPARRPALRLRVPDAELTFEDIVFGSIRQNLAREVGDFVLRRADGLWAYQLAVVVDDQAQGITEVVRGADLLDSTPRQIWLQHVLGYATPTYLHLPLVLDAKGAKLSKSEGAGGLDTAAPLPALQAALAHLGLSADPLEAQTSLDEMLGSAVRHFKPERLRNCAASRSGTSKPEA